MPAYVQSEVPAIALRANWDPACSADIFAPNGNCANATTLENHKLAFKALYSRDTAMMKRLLSRPNFTGANAIGQYGGVNYCTVLHYAASFNDPDLAKMIAPK